MTFKDNMPKIAYIFANGEFSKEVLFHIKGEERSSSIIICADGGIRHFELLKNDKSFAKTPLHQELISKDPDFIVGDFDSATQSVDDMRDSYKNSRLIVLSPEKNETDLEIAIGLAVSENVDEIIIFGGTGSRLDHTISNAMMLFSIYEKNIRASLIDEKNLIMPIIRSVDPVVIPAINGYYISLVPVDGDLEGVNYTGMKYPLENAKIKFGSPIGVSNEPLVPNPTVQIESGKGLLIISKD